MNRIEVLLSIQRALVGAITPRMRAITIGFKSNTNIPLRVYFESQPSEEEFDVINTITGEVAGDFPEIDDFPEEIIVNSTTKVNKLPVLDAWVYMRYEGD